MKEAYPNNKLFAVFELRSATSRRAIFQKEYAQAFGAADDIIIAPLLISLKYRRSIDLVQTL